MSQDVRRMAETYFDAWRSKRFDTLRSILADDVTFVGPLGTANNAEECVAGIAKLSEIVTDIDVKKVFTDGPDVLTWFELHTAVAPPCPVVNWSHVEHSKINRIRVTFDPRPLLQQG